MKKRNPTLRSLEADQADFRKQLLDLLHRVTVLEADPNAGLAFKPDGEEEDAVSGQA